MNTPKYTTQPRSVSRAGLVERAARIVRDACKEDTGWSDFEAAEAILALRLSPTFSEAQIRGVAVAIAEQICSAGGGTVRARSGMRASINEHSFDCEGIARAALAALAERP